MVSRKVAAVAAFSLMLATTPAGAQTADPTPPPTAQTAPPAKAGPTPLGDRDDFTRSGLFFMLLAITGAVLLAVLATQVGGDKPQSP